MEIRFRLLLTLISLVFCTALSGQTPPSLTEEQRFRITFESLSRLKGASTNSAVQEVIVKTLAKLRGTSGFVELVKELQLRNQDEGLLEVAQKFPATDSGVEAMRMVLANGDTVLIEKSLQETAHALSVVEALGNTGKKEAVPFLAPIVADATRDLALRKKAVGSLAQTPEGANHLLSLAREDKLAKDLKTATGTALRAVRWESVKEEAEKIFPQMRARDSQPLPTVSELVRLQGDAAKGQTVFYQNESACSQCHQINGKGGEVGPALSEIGNKLGKEALYEAILDPSAGISFGFEATQIELQSGDEAFGLVTGETESELALKDLKGIVSHYKKSEISKRQQLKSSLMPADLQQTMSVQELADLVEFLLTLRKSS